MEPQVGCADHATPAASDEEVTMVAVRLARSGHYLRAEALRQGVQEACPDATPEQVHRALVRLAQRCCD